MDNEPRDRLWWLPWHWGRRLWVAAILIGALLSLACGLLLTLGILYRTMGI